jgi:LacI family transcriptional regulator
VQLTAEKMKFEFNTVQNSQPCGTRCTIGVILPFLNKENMADIVAGMIEMSNQLGFDVIFAQTFGFTAKEIELTREMLKRKVDGLLICLAHEKAEMKHFSKYQKHNIPICSFCNVWNHPYSSHVHINDFRAAHDLTIHLLNEGCEYIAYVTSNTSNNTHQNRLEGYKEALVERRVQFDEKLVFNTDLSVAAGERVAKQIF